MRLKEGDRKVLWADMRRSRPNILGCWGNQIVEYAMGKSRQGQGRRNAGKILQVVTRSHYNHHHHIRFFITRIYRTILLIIPITAIIRLICTSSVSHPAHVPTNPKSTYFDVALELEADILDDALADIEPIGVLVSNLS